MVDVDGLGERGYVVLLGTVEVAHLQLKLQTLEVVEVLQHVVLPKLLKPKALIPFKISKSLLVLNCLWRIVSAEDIDKLCYLLLHSSDFFRVTSSKEIFICQVVVYHIPLVFIFWAFVVTFNMSYIIFCNTQNNIYFNSHQLLNYNKVREITHFLNILSFTFLYLQRVFVVINREHLCIELLLAALK